MTQPRSIGQVAPGGNSDGSDFTKKDDIENVPVIITSARTANGKSGPFWIIEAARKDTGEAVVFTGGKVVDQQIGQVKDQNAFPVLAMVSKIHPEGGGNDYWMLVDPPGTPAPNGSVPDDRIAKVQEIVAFRGLNNSDVAAQVAELGGAGKKVRDLDDATFEKLLDRLMSMGTPQEAPPPDSEPPF